MRAIAWFFAHGLREYGLMEAVDVATLAALDETPPFLQLPIESSLGQSSLTWLMFFVWRSRDDLQMAFDLRNAMGQIGLLQWFFFEGMVDLQLESLVARRWRDWLRKPVLLTQSSVTVPRAISLMWQRRDDWQQAFDLGAAPPISQ